LEKFHLLNILEFGSSITRIFQYICKYATFLCQMAIDFIVETKKTNRINFKDLSDIFRYEPGGTSTKNLIHWIQMFRKKKLTQFDYGTKGNIAIYGSPNPPEIDIKNFKQYNVKSFVTLADCDPFSDETDLDLLLNNMDDSKKDLITVKRLVNYNHLDYIWSESAVKDIYEDVIKFLS
jgi:hypothetical protein